jgi:hypothetical protein
MTTATPPTKDTDATKSPDQLFRYSAWVHVGAGAERCEEGETGSCGNPLHFHAWCRLPNQLQHQEIRERALAAKARRIRQLRDPESDAAAVLESDMDELVRVADVDELVEELAGKEWWKRQLEAMADTEADDDFKNVERDRDRFNELRALDPDERPKDEYEELDRHLARFNDRVDARRAELDEPVKASYAQMSKEQLVSEIREERITAESSQAFMDAYSVNAWLAGCYRSDDPINRQRSFLGAKVLAEAAPEVLDALRATFSELEASLQRGAQGN